MHGLWASVFFMKSREGGSKELFEKGGQDASGTPGMTGRYGLFFR